MSRAGLIACLAAVATLLAPDGARAADILFVADSDGDLELVDALTADGHTVDVVTGDFSGGTNTRLRSPVDEYDAVYWSADGPGYGDEHTDAAVFANLTAYVRAGGRVFVTGFDSIASPTDPMLIAFLGGSSSRDVPPAPGAIVTADNSLTTGLVDIRGLTPPDVGDMDCLTGLQPDTTAVSSADADCAVWSLRSLGEGEIAYISMGASGTFWVTTGGTAGVYNAAARNFVARMDSSMADDGAPAIEIDAPFTADEGSAITFEASITDAEGDSFTFSWDLDDDGTFGENADSTTYVIEAGTTDGPVSVRVGVRAVDAHGNTATRYRNLRIGNVAPIIRSEAPEVASVGVDLGYELEVHDPAGEDDSLTFTIIRGPARMVITPGGVVQWTASHSDITEGDERVTAEVLVEDDDGGSSTQTWEMIVTPDRQPTPPSPAYPADMIAILEHMPRFVVANSEDLDLDPLTYSFELDTVDTFDSSALRTSGPIEETPGFTAWQLTEPLQEGRIYYWRVWANDGELDSRVRTTAFFVVRDPSLPPPDAGPPDAMALGDGGLIPGIDAGIGDRGRGCSCRAGGSSGGHGGLAFVLAGLALVARRRRGRSRAA